MNIEATQVEVTEPEECERLVVAAMEARDDGDLEESAALFQAILNRFPGNPEASLQYVHTLKKLHWLDEADQVLTAAMAANPNNLSLLHNWAELPAHSLDHDNVIRRGAVYRAAFPPPLFWEAWHNLTISLWALVESLRWDRLRAALEAMRDEALRYPQALRLALWHANELGLTDHLKDIIGAARPEAWAHLPPEAKTNAGLRMEMAILNRRLLEATKFQIIPLGQNCLPYLLGGRWGLIAERERAEAMTPFDRGAFQNDNAATVIDTDFDGFSEVDAFELTGSFDGKQMYRHKATQVYFYHERGTYWLQDDGARFFPHLDLMLANWRRISTAGRRLFAFCLCGQGDLEKLVEVCERHLLSPESHLLVIDVLQQPHACPVHDGVTYVHAPYPADYAWDDFVHQSGARGIGFELSVVNPIFDYLISLLPAAEAATFTEHRRRLLQDAAAASAARDEHRNSVTLYKAVSGDRAEGRSEVGYALALRQTGNIDEANNILARAKEQDPTNYDACAAWAEFGVAPFDWSARLQRLRSLRQAFPPQSEPRSWATFIEELKICDDFGQWEEAVALIDSRWDDFTTRGDLFPAALNTLILLGLLTMGRHLLDEAAPSARGGLPRQTMEFVLHRLDQAKANKLLLQRCNAQVIPLGQNGLPTLLVARWGLRRTMRTYNGSTPFEFGDFFHDNVADAIADDFAALSDREDFIEKPAWGGGNLLRHVRSDIAFMVHRNSTIGPAEKARFFTHLDRMVTQWHEVKHASRRIFLHCRFDNSNLHRLVGVAKEKLLGANDELIIINVNGKPEALSKDHRVKLLNAPLPKNYPWFDALGSATPEGVQYDERVLAPVLDCLQRYDQRRSA